MALAGQSRRAASCGAAVVLKQRTSFGNCDPAVIQHPLGTSRKAGIGFKNWSGARDLNPGPHGPEPCVCRVLVCPAGSSSVLLYSISRAVVSFRVLLVPRMRDTSVTRFGATGSRASI